MRERSMPGSDPEHSTPKPKDQQEAAPQPLDAQEREFLVNCVTGAVSWDSFCEAMQEHQYSQERVAYFFELMVYGLLTRNAHEELQHIWQESQKPKSLVSKEMMLSVVERALEGGFIAWQALKLPFLLGKETQDDDEDEILSDDEESFLMAFKAFYHKDFVDAWHQDFKKRMEGAVPQKIDDSIRGFTSLLMSSESKMLAMNEWEMRHLLYNAKEIMAEYIPQIVQSVDRLIQQDDPENKKDYKYSCEALLALSEEHNRQGLRWIKTSERGQVVDAVDRHFDIFRSELEIKDTAVAVFLMMRYGNTAQQEKGKNFLKKHFEETLHGESLDHLDLENTLYETGSPKIKQCIASIMTPTLRPYGLRARETLEAWCASYRERKKWDSPFIMNIRELQNLDPATVKTLNHEFGITDVARYPVELLRHQYERRNDISRPYGIIIYPSEDYKGSFYSDSRHLQELLEQIGNVYNIRAVECKSSIDVVRKLGALDRRYGAQQKISFAIVGGHGTPKTIAIGGRQEGKRSHIELKDMQRPRTASLAALFTPHPTFILFSCSTGRQQGIGQELSRLFNATVFAPDVPTGPASIEAIVQPDKTIKWNVEFQEESSGQQFVAGAPTAH